MKYIQPRTPRIMMEHARNSMKKNLRKQPHPLFFFCWFDVLFAPFFPLSNKAFCEPLPPLSCREACASHASALPFRLFCHDATVASTSFWAPLLPCLDVTEASSEAVAFIS